MHAERTVRAGRRSNVSGPMATVEVVVYHVVVMVKVTLIVVTSVRLAVGCVAAVYHAIVSTIVVVAIVAITVVVVAAGAIVIAVISGCYSAHSCAATTHHSAFVG